MSQKTEPLSRSVFATRRVRLPGCATLPTAATGVTWRGLFELLLILLLLMVLLIVAACAPSPQRELSMADMDVIARDDRFALVRLGRQQTFEDLAYVFLGHRAESWQIKEVNADQSAQSGPVVAVPLQPVNSSSVYTVGYRTLPILCYHQFSTGKASHELELSAREFEQQIK